MESFARPLKSLLQRKKNRLSAPPVQDEGPQYVPLFHRRDSIDNSEEEENPEGVINVTEAPLIGEQDGGSGLENRDSGVCLSDDDYDEDNKLRSPPLTPKSLDRLNIRPTQSPKLLLEHIVDPNTHDYRGKTPLHYAVSAVLSNSSNLETSLEKLTILLRRGGNPNLADSTGNSALHYALNLEPSSGDTPLDVQTTVVALLLHHGADPNLRDRMGNSSLHHSLFSYQHSTPKNWGRQLVLAKLLLEHGGNPNSCDIYGVSGLHRAVEGFGIVNAISEVQGGAERKTARDAVEVVRECLVHGGDPSLRDNLGRTALQRILLARESRACAQVIRMLLEHGASEEGLDEKERGVVKRAYSAEFRTSVKTPWEVDAEVVEIASA
jgi:ankyrin repeat protein